MKVPLIWPVFVSFHLISKEISLGCPFQPAEQTFTLFSFCSSEDKVKVNFINRDGEKLTAVGNLGDTLLDVVIENDLDIDGFGKSSYF